jgi:hypothetical protein
MGIGCILSILLVMVESFDLVKGKLDKEEQYERLERINQELVGIVEKKVVFFPLGKKSTLLFIKPNFFQFTTLLNFITLLIVIMIRFGRVANLSKINLESDEYINLINKIASSKNITLIDAMNTFLIFFSLFYYTA